MKKQLQNPNSSGQGLDPDHVFHPLHATTVKEGYEYSYSVYLCESLYHRYAHPSNREHRVSLNDRTLDWIGSIGGRSFRKCGDGATTLTAYLKDKNRRFKLTNISKEGGVTRFNVGDFKAFFTGFLELLGNNRLIPAIQMLREFSVTNEGFKLLKPIYLNPNAVKFDRKDRVKNTIGLKEAKDFADGVRDGKILLVGRLYGSSHFMPLR